MKVGVDGFTLHPCGLTSAFQIFEFVRGHNLSGVLLPGLRWLSETLDRGQLREIRQEAVRLELYSHVSISSPNAVIYKPARSPNQLFEILTEEIEAASQAGWHELHACLGGFEERYCQDPPLRRQLEAVTELLRRLTPVLRGCGSRINLEDHADLSTFEIVRLVEEIGPDALGCCLDTANVLCQAEDPLWAIRRAAPYTHMTRQGCDPLLQRPWLHAPGPTAGAGRNSMGTSPADPAPFLAGSGTVHRGPQVGFRDARL